MRSATITGHEIAGPVHVTADMHVSAVLGIADPVDRSVDGPIAGPSEGPDRLATESCEILALIRDGRHRDAIAACARAHGPVLGRPCMALLGSQADAGEATQETRLPVAGSSRTATRPRPLTDTGPCDTPLR
jgi:hypothetical protein